MAWVALAHVCLLSLTGCEWLANNKHTAAAAALVRTSKRVFLRATSLPLVLSFALYTFPYVPSPIFSIFS